MNKVLCMIQDDLGAAIALYIGRDNQGHAYWEPLAYSDFAFGKFARKKGDWWYNPSTTNLDIYTSDGKSNHLEFRLVGVPHNFLPADCGPDTLGSGMRFPNQEVTYRIGGSGTCNRLPPNKPRRGR